MTFDAMVFDTGHPSHGMCFGMNMNLLPFHGEMCEIEIEPLCPYSDTPLASFMDEAAGRSEPVEYPPAYRGHHMVFFDQQSGQGATIGRCPEVERFHRWVCRISIGKVALETIPTEELMAMIGGL